MKNSKKSDFEKAIDYIKGEGSFTSLFDGFIDNHNKKHNNFHHDKTVDEFDSSEEFADEYADDFDSFEEAMDYYDDEKESD